MIDIYCFLTIGEAGLNSLTYKEMLSMTISDVFRAKQFVEQYRKSLSKK